MKYNELYISRKTFNKKDGLMGQYQIFILCSLGVLTLIVVILTFNFKRLLNLMNRMIISMFFGMNMGLTVGLLLGSTFQGNLFYSTILSIAIALLAASLSSISFGIMPILEGLMAGLMGGMMGAMLGEMMKIEQSIFIIRIFLFLSISTVFLFPLLQNEKSQRIKNKVWLIKPVVLTCFIILFIVMETNLAQNQFNTLSKSSQSHAHHIENTSKNVKSDSKVISIQAQNMNYSQKEIIVENNQPVTLILENKDQIEHDIEINLPIRDNKSLKKHHGTNENSVHLHVKPKSTEQINFTPIASGIYEFICTIPGYKESGMVGQFIVNKSVAF
ncbi:cupredoxin domain-containing protein [Rummeliibacillus pycnus]|uniref:cupredoxin domain-containing protein n=1 Tax=Rummeliibacillus pycnus TaxID=101070 RepID=UPI003D294E78